MRKSKQRILKEASKLFSKFGFSGVSMGNIAKKLGITKAALYYHFESKKELYLKVLEDSFERLIKNIEGKISKVKSKEEIVFKVIEGYLEFGLKEKNLIKSSFLKLSKEDLEIKNYIIKLRKEINLKFENYLEGVLRKKTNFVSILLGTIDRIIIEASLFNKKINIKKVVSQILRIFFPTYGY